MARVRPFMNFHQTERRQYSNIPSDCGPVSLENCRQFRNRRRMYSYCLQNANPLLSEHPDQIGGIFKGQTHLRKERFAAIQFLCARC